MNGVATDVLSNILNVTMNENKTVVVTYKAIPHTHTYDQEIQKPETLKSAADCTNDAVYFKSCSCGAISTTETFTAAGTQLGTHGQAIGARTQTIIGKNALAATKRRTRRLTITAAITSATPADITKLYRTRTI